MGIPVLKTGLDLSQFWDNEAGNCGVSAFNHNILPRDP
jgi:hypothetical protein